eukprot:XP_765811.1 hypothetical protein [Theileria parva strain Muguga]
MEIMIYYMLHIYFNNFNEILRLWGYPMEDDENLNYNFSLKSFEICSKFTKSSDNNVSDNEEEVQSTSEMCEYFVNCDGQIRDVDILHTLVYSQFENVLLILVATNSTSHYFTNEDDFYTFLQLYTLKFDSENSLNLENSLQLLSLFPVKMDYCVQLKWLQVNYETGFLFAVLLFNSGKVKIARFNINKLSNLLQSTQDLSKRVLDLEFVWEYNQNINYNNKINCFDISYKICESLVMLACGTNDGFLLILDFNLNLFNSNTHTSDTKDEVDCIEVDSEVVDSFKTVPVLTGVNNTPVYRSILSLNFLPLPNSFILAIGTFSKGVVLWDVRHVDGELKTYSNIMKPVNKVNWSRNSQFLLCCTSSGLYIDWQNNTTANSINPVKLSKDKINNVWDNICWNVDSSDDTITYSFDSGQLIQLMMSNMNKKNIYNDFTIYQWDFLKPQMEMEVYKYSDSMVDNVNYSMKNRFIKDLNFAKKVGISITKSNSSVNTSNVEPNDNLLKMRTKILSLNTESGTPTPNTNG